MAIEEAVDYGGVETSGPDGGQRLARTRNGPDPHGAGLDRPGTEGVPPCRERRDATPTRFCDRSDAELLAMMKTVVDRAYSLLPPTASETDPAPGARASRTEELFAILQAMKEGRIPLRP